MMANLITLPQAVRKIKTLVETAIKNSGTEGKNNLIRSQEPIKLLHEVVKAEFLRNAVNPQNIHPPKDQKNGELALAGFFKKKDQDICIVPSGLRPNKETLSSPGILYGQDDIYGFDYTEKTLSVNVRSQLSSSAKNFDTMYERTFAESLNLHLRCPNMVLGELYMIAVNEYDSDAANNNKVKYKKMTNVAKHIEKYLLSFSAVNRRATTTDEHYKYERVCLLIVDFSTPTPKIYNTDADLRADKLLPDETIATIQDLSFTSFVADLLQTYSTRFGAGRFI
jgi:hypothetical protein